MPFFSKIGDDAITGEITYTNRSLVRNRLTGRLWATYTKEIKRWIDYEENDYAISRQVIAAYSDDDGRTWTSEVAYHSSEVYSNYYGLAYPVICAQDDDTVHIFFLGPTWGEVLHYSKRTAPNTWVTEAWVNCDDYCPTMVALGPDDSVYVGCGNSSEMYLRVYSEGTWGDFETVPVVTGGFFDLDVDSLSQPHFIYRTQGGFTSTSLRTHYHVAKIDGAWVTSVIYAGNHGTSNVTIHAGCSGVWSCWQEQIPGVNFVSRLRVHRYINGAWVDHGHVIDETTSGGAFTRANLPSVSNDGPNGIRIYFYDGGGGAYIGKVCWSEGSGWGEPEKIDLDPLYYRVVASAARYSPMFAFQCVNPNLYDDPNVEYATDYSRYFYSDIDSRGRCFGTIIG